MSEEPVLRRIRQRSNVEDDRLTHSSATLPSHPQGKDDARKIERDEMVTSRIKEACLDLTSKLQAVLPREIRDMVYDFYWASNNHREIVHSTLNGWATFQCSFTQCACWSAHNGPLLVNPEFVGHAVAQEAMEFFLETEDTGPSFRPRYSEEYRLQRGNINLWLVPDVEQSTLWVDKTRKPRAKLASWTRVNALDRYLDMLAEDYVLFHRYQVWGSHRLNASYGQQQGLSETEKFAMLFEHLAPILSQVQEQGLASHTYLVLRGHGKLPWKIALDISKLNEGHVGEWAEKASEHTVGVIELHKELEDEPDTCAVM